MSEKENQYRNAAKETKKCGKEEKEIHSDVLGSYTGVPEEGEMPEQDADDL